MEIDYDWSNNLTCNPRGKGKPCLELSNDFQGWMQKKNGL